MFLWHFPIYLAHIHILEFKTAGYKALHLAADFYGQEREGRETKREIKSSYSPLRKDNPKFT